MYPQSMFSAKIRKYQNVSDDISFFTTKKNLCILHGQVIVMQICKDLKQAYP